MKTKESHKNYLRVVALLMILGVFVGLNFYKVRAQVNTTDVAIINSSTQVQSENSVFISPLNRNHVLNANNDAPWPVASPLAVSEFTSINGGLSWIGSGGGVLSSRADPATAIGLSGRYFLGYINTGFGQSIAFSDNMGATWTEVTVAPNPGSSADKNHLWIDNSVISIHSGNLYSAWTDFGGTHNNEIVISRSTNGGLAWSTRVNISAGVNALSHNQGVNIQTGPVGEVYVCWAIYDAFPSDEVAIGFNKSTDGGATWGTAARIQNIDGHRNTALGGGKNMRHASFPSMTVNQQNGEIYIVWTDQPGSHPDIFMIKSSDGGNTWGSGVKVNQDATTRDQWLPWIACDEISGGLVAIYYDSRNFTSNDRAETFVSLSYDGGTSWEDHLISDTDWDGDGIPGYSGNYAGDYIGIDVYHGWAVPVWSDKRAGNMLAFTQPFLVPCPTDLTLCKGFIVDEAFYKVTNDIFVTTTSGCKYVVEVNASSTMQAGRQMTINEGFHAKQGCVFNAYIDPTCPSFSEKNGLVDNASSNMGNWGSDLEDPIQDQNVVIINYPNPFNNYTTIDYTILNQGYLSIKIYNLFGEEVEIIVGNKFHDPGNYKLQLDTKDLADGVYVCSVQLLAGKDQQNEREELINKHVNDLKGIDQSIENMVMLPTTDEDHESFSLLSDNQTNKALFIKMIKLNNN